MGDVFEFVELETEDGLALPAAWWASAGTFEGAVDGIVLAPRVMGSFHDALLRALARTLSANGLPCLTMSTRGHHVLWKSDPTGGRYFGQAVERLDECVLDFAAAFGEMERRGLRRIALLGHSLSGAKALWFAARTEDARFRAVVSCSGPRFSDRLYRESDQAEEFLRCRQRAEEMVAAGRGGEFFEADFPTGRNLFFTAEAYLEKYGGETYDPLATAHRIRVPLMMVIGEKEHIVPLEGFSEAMVARATASPAATVFVVPEGDHSYTGREALVAETIAAWLRNPEGR